MFDSISLFPIPIQFQFTGLLVNNVMQMLKIWIIFWCIWNYKDWNGILLISLYQTSCKTTSANYMWKFKIIS